MVRSLIEMRQTLTIVNDDNHIEAARQTSTDYLSHHPEVEARIAAHFWAYNEIGELIPQTLDNFGSGHYFPYSESYTELENSYQLCIEGFYRHAFSALRSVLELGVLGVFFAVNDKEHQNVRPWITGKERTPRFRGALDTLRLLPTVERFDSRFALMDRVGDLFDELGGFVHTRGYTYSSTAQTRANFNVFSVDSLRRYCDLMASVVSNLVVIMLLKYPIGIQGLPLSEKFGLRVPAGGLLEAYQVEQIASVVAEDEWQLLQELSDADPVVRSIVESVHSFPDLSEEEWREHIEEFRRLFPVGALPTSIPEEP